MTYRLTTDNNVARARGFDFSLGDRLELTRPSRLPGGSRKAARTLTHWTVVAFDEGFYIVDCASNPSPLTPEECEVVNNGCSILSMLAAIRGTRLGVILLEDQESWDLAPLPLKLLCTRDGLRLYFGGEGLWQCKCGDVFETTREALDHVGI